jgi:hypothetical protein
MRLQIILIVLSRTDGFELSATTLLLLFKISLKVVMRFVYNVGFASNTTPELNGLAD